MNLPTVDRRILLVEDNPDHAEIARFHINQCDPDIEVVTLRDGAEVLERITSCRESGRNDCPWLILLDIKLPKYDGLEILEKLKGDEAMRIIPVVMFTTSNARQDIERALALGANSYIQKPVEAGEFGPLIDHIIAYWKLNQHGMLKCGGPHG